MKTIFGGEKMSAKYNMMDDISAVLADENKINETVARLGAKISEDYEGNRLLIIGTLKGALPFMGALLGKVTIPCEIDFMKVSSYGSGTKTSGQIKVLLDLIRSDLNQCDVLIVEDIIDSGRTLANLTGYMQERGAKSVRTCTLLDKPSRREVDFKADYVGMVIPDEFVVGFGLDYNEKYRNLPVIGILKKEIYSV